MGTSTTMGLVMIVGILVLLVLCIMLYMKQRTAERADRMIKTKKKNGRNYFYHLYITYISLPFVKSYFNKLRNRLQGVFPADEIAINMKATKIFTLGLGVSAAIIVVTTVAAGGDIFFILAGITMTYIMFITVVDKSVETMEMNLMMQFKDLIDQIREEYNRLGRVDDAISYTLDKLPYEIGLHATKMHQVLTSTDVEKEANKYIDIAPNKFFMTFTAIAATTVEYGDKKMENGESLFLKNLNFLKEEVNIELLKERKNTNLFSGLTLVALIPIFAIKPIENWAMHNMSEISEFYKGSYGIICMALVFFFSAVAYTVIGALKNGRQAETTDTTIYKAIAEIPPIKRFLNRQVTRNYTKCQRHNDMLRYTGDKQGINAFIVKRYVFAAVAMAVTFALMTTSVLRERSMQLHDFADAFDSSIVADADYRATMEGVAEDWTTTMKSMNVEDVSSDEYKKELTQDILEQGEIKDEKYAEMIAEAVMKHLDGYHAIYFKWFYLLAVFGAAIAGYMVPLWILMFQMKSIKMNMEDEVAQFQTIALMLMHVDGVNTVMLLEWLERFAYCFKESISECIVELPHNGQKALIKMQDKESFEMFKSFVNNLLSIDSVGVEKSFSNVETDREYYKEKRKEDNDMLMKKKADIGKWVAMIPLVFVFGAYLIYPMIKLAMSMMSEINGAL